VTGAFAYRATQDGKVLISWQGRQVMTLAGGRARSFITGVDGLPDEEVQFAMARVTGNFKRGNER
jgi:hypothetical protein